MAFEILYAYTQRGLRDRGSRAIPNFVAVGGCVLIQAGGALLGTIGVSGAPGGDADEACARTGIAAIVDIER